MRGEEWREVEDPAPLCDGDCRFRLFCGFCFWVSWSLYYPSRTPSMILTRCGRISGRAEPVRRWKPPGSPFPPCFKIIRNRPAPAPARGSAGRCGGGRGCTTLGSVVLRGEGGWQKWTEERANIRLLILICCSEYTKFSSESPRIHVPLPACLPALPACVPAPQLSRSGALDAAKGATDRFFGLWFFTGHSIFRRRFTLFLQIKPLLFHLG